MVSALKQFLRPPFWSTKIHLNESVQTPTFLPPKENEPAAFVYSWIHRRGSRSILVWECFLLLIHAPVRRLNERTVPALQGHRRHGWVMIPHRLHNREPTALGTSCQNMHNYRAETQVNLPTMHLQPAYCHRHITLFGHAIFVSYQRAQRNLYLSLASRRKTSIWINLVRKMA